MNVRRLCFVHILFIILLRSHSCKLCYIPNPVLKKKKISSKILNYFMELISTKNVRTCSQKKKKKKYFNTSNFNRLMLNDDKTYTNFLKTERVVMNDKDDAAIIGMFNYISQCIDKSGSKDNNGEIKSMIKKINDITNIIFIEVKGVVKKYPFFKYQIGVNNIPNRQVENRELGITRLCHNLLFPNTWKYYAVRLYMYNVYLAIIRIIENTLGNKIFYVDMKEELTKRKDIIINMLYDIYRVKHVDSTYKDSYNNMCNDRHNSNAHCDRKPIRILYIGSNEFSAMCLKIILLIIKTIRNDIKVEDIITKSPRRKGRNLHVKKSNVEEEARKNKINVFYYDKFKNTIHQLKNKLFDLCISISFGEIFNSSFFKTVNSNIFSLHPSLLPLYKGASPIQRSLLNNESIFGYTVFLTNLRIDAGTTLIKKSFHFDETFNFNDIITILFTLGTLHLIKNIFFLANYNNFIHKERLVYDIFCNSFSTRVNNEYTENIKCSYANKKGVFPMLSSVNSELSGVNCPHPRCFPTSSYNNSGSGDSSSSSSSRSRSDEHTSGSCSCNGQSKDNKNYAPKIKAEEKYVCFFCSSSMYIHNKVRGFINWPKAECSLFLYQNNAIKKIEVKLIKTSYDLYVNNNNYAFRKFHNSLEGHKCFDNVPRKFAILDKNSINIQCKDNTLLRIYKLQRKNKKIMDAMSFFNSINKVYLLY
ncbi:methionyl-tRNA formyltransferase, putative [Plasmodium malariae]|uniref:Methionyl-tRNA formyltransferase, putative n=2 Tax=Plasmodium malariae TaxID=5858 RepID=A0A1D3TE73_PLAMA|nr:methionyl-tRNA formyltransferase, putative [Plasmodium malariae]SCP03245.1 methionyl-tRNA formyltransferase, putative [Plasmodium malariae]